MELLKVFKDKKAFKFIDKRVGHTSSPRRRERSRRKAMARKD